MPKSGFDATGRALAQIAWHFGPKEPLGECCEDLTMPEFLALDKISVTPDCPVHEIGIVLGFSKSGATRVVNRLEKKDYIRRVRSSEDGRVCCVEITDRGAAALLSAKENYQKRFEKIVKKLPHDTARQIINSISLLAAALEK